MDDHDHIYGEVERSRFVGTVHRKCTVDGCPNITLDLDGEDDSLDVMHVAVDPERDLAVWIDHADDDTYIGKASNGECIKWLGTGSYRRNCGMDFGVHDAERLGKKDAAEMLATYGPIIARAMCEPHSRNLYGVWYDATLTTLIAESEGAAAFAAGIGRMTPYPPPDAPVGSPASKAWVHKSESWQRGWDAANMAAEVPA